MANLLRTHKHILVFALLTLGLIPISIAAVYLHKDKDGNIIISDVPKDDATILTSTSRKTPKTIISSRRIQIDSEESATVTSHTVTTNNATVSKSNKAAVEAFKNKPYYTSINIIKPTPDSIITNTSGNFKVIVKTLPALQNRHKIQLLINEKARGALHGYRFNISKANDGELSLQANIIDAENNILKSSEKVYFSVIRAAR